MASIDPASGSTVNPNGVTPQDTNVAPTANSDSQPSNEAVDAFEALVSQDETAETTAEGAETTSGGETENGVSVDDIREGIRDQIIRDIITKQTTFQI